MVKFAVLIISCTLVLPPGWCCWQPRLGNDSGKGTVTSCPKCCHRATSDSSPTPNSPIRGEDSECPCQSRLAIIGSSGDLEAKILEFQVATIFDWVTTQICVDSNQLAVYRPPCPIWDVNHHALFCVWRC